MITPGEPGGHRKSMFLVIDIYKEPEQFSDSEVYGLTSQRKRRVISVPSDIAGGTARQTTKDHIRFLYIAPGSLSELKTQLEIANQLHFCSDYTPLNERIEYIRRMLLNYIKSIRSKLT